MGNTIKSFRKHSPATMRGILALLFSVTVSALFSQTSYTFTPAGATASNGPTQLQVNTSYQSTNLNNSVTVNNGIQTFLIPTTGAYRISAYGAQGGGADGGRGAIIEGDFNFVANEVVRIVVGQTGITQSAEPNACSGGGGTYVMRGTNNGTIDILVIAGGGGGSPAAYSAGRHASTLTAGNNGMGVSNTDGAGGTNGNGGNKGIAANTQDRAAGGGGFFTDGQSTAQTGFIGAANGGSAFVNGSNGGSNNTTGAPGGFGGGGAVWTTGHKGGGGGGGYSGGGGGQTNGANANTHSGGGGGSFNNGTNQSNTISTDLGDGKVIITSLCDIAITAASNPICYGQNVILTTNAASSISWNTGATTNTIMVSPTVTTTYSVTGTSTSNCTSSSFISVQVNPLPTVTGMSFPSVLCVGDDATLTASGASSYTWSSTQIDYSITASPAATTNYTVKGTSLAGCINSVIVTVNVNTNSLTTTSNTSICLGNSLLLNASGANSYTWSTGSLFSSITVTPTIQTIYTVSGTDALKCKLNKLILIGINPNPTVVVTASRNSICKGETVELSAQGALSYSWSSGQTTPTISLTPLIDVLYHYTVVGTDNNGCVNQVVTPLQVLKCTAIDENSSSVSLAEFFPNPSSGTFNLKTKNFNSTTKATITSVTGELIFSQQISSENTEIKIQVKAGIYVLSLMENNKIVQRTKIVIQ